jgi:hypothetical protein
MSRTFGKGSPRQEGWREKLSNGLKNKPFLHQFLYGLPVSSFYHVKTFLKSRNWKTLKSRYTSSENGLSSSKSARGSLSRRLHQNTVGIITLVVGEERVTGSAWTRTSSSGFREKGYISYRRGVLSHTFCSNLFDAVLLSYEDHGGYYRSFHAKL